ncbi:MAG: hypothetical protein OWU33_14160, partial [Firmicutes bacterium]|nr:hypothetical protein [Bacillota bacterium]
DRRVGTGTSCTDGGPGYTVPRSAALRHWFAAHRAELDESLPIVFTRAQALAEQAQRELENSKVVGSGETDRR